MKEKLESLIGIYMVVKKGFKWDGKSRVSNDTYRKNFNKIFKIKELPKLKQDIVKSVTQTNLNKKYGDLVETIIQRKMSENPFKKEQDELDASYKQSISNKKERDKNDE